MTFNLDREITLRKLVEQHPEWADLPIAVEAPDRGVGECTWPMVYTLIPEEGEEGFGNPEYNCLVLMGG
jgi:hypothetical protein